MSKKQKKKRRLIRLIPKLALLAFALYCAVTLVSTQIKINEQRQNIVVLKQQIDSQAQKQAVLQQLLSEDSTDSIMLSEAQKQGYAALDELVFIDISGK